MAQVIQPLTQRSPTNSGGSSGGVIHPLTQKGGSTTKTATKGVVQPLSSAPAKATASATPTAIKQVQAPKGGFKVGDIVSEIKNTASKVVQKLEPKLTQKPITLTSGTKINLVNPTVKAPAKPNLPQPDLGLPQISNFDPKQKKLTTDQMSQISGGSATMTNTPQSRVAAGKFIKQENQASASAAKNFPGTNQLFKDLTTDPLSLKVNPKKTIEVMKQDIKQPLQQEKQRIQAVFKTKKATSARAGAEVSAVTGGANVLFSPISALFHGADQIPVLGTVSRLIGGIFTIAGESGAAAANKVIDELPIDKQIKNNLKPGLAEVAAIAATIYVGGKIGGAKKAELIDKFGKEDATTIIKKGQEIADEKKNQRTEFTPQEVIDHVVNNKIQDTPDGKTLIKTSIQAEKDGKNIELASVEASKPMTPKETSDYIAKYIQKFGNVIDSDNAKELLPGYHPSKAPEFHKQSGVVRDAVYEHLLEKNRFEGNGNVHFTAGGAAAGKTESLTLAKGADHSIVYNTTLSSPARVTDFRRALDKGYSATVDYIAADPVKAWERVKQRGRDIPLDSFVRDYVQAHENVIKLYKEFKNDDRIEFKFIDNTGEVGSAKEVSFDKINQMKYNEDEIRKGIENASSNETRTKSNERQSVQTTPEKPQQRNGEEIRPSKIGKSIESKAVESKLTKGFSETAGYTPITIKAQAEKASKLVNEDLEGARAVLRGEQPLPEDLRGISLITAMEEYIKKNPDAGLAYELANSPLVSETSAAAQELRLAAEREPDSAAARLMEIKKARLDKVKNAPAKKERITATLKTDINKINITEKEGLSWDKFLNDIAC